MKRVDRIYVRPARKVLRKRKFGGLSPFLCCPGKWSGLNRISHPHWVKICDDHNGQINLRAKRKYEVLSATWFLTFVFFFANCTLLVLCHLSVEFRNILSLETGKNSSTFEYKTKSFCVVCLTRMRRSWHSVWSNRI